jgi:enoyl-CoA hydratase/carnithine racemase
MDYNGIRLELDEATCSATLLLDRGQNNLLSIDTIEEMVDALLSLRGKRWLEVLVIRGARCTFSEGFDL